MKTAALVSTVMIASVTTLPHSALADRCVQPLDLSKESLGTGEWLDVYSANALRALESRMGPFAAEPEALTQFTDTGRLPVPYDVGSKAPLTIDGTGHGPVNIDYYEVTFNAVPGETPETLFAKFRKNASEKMFSGLPTGYSLTPLTETDGIRWQSDKLGSIYGTEMSFVLAPSITGDDGPPVEKASVICSCTSKKDWIFSTIATERDGVHPVSGSRSFGIVDNQDGTWTMFTKGTDRTTDPRGIHPTLPEDYLTVGVGAIDSRLILNLAPIIWDNLMNNLAEDLSGYAPKVRSHTATIPYEEYRAAMDAAWGKPLFTDTFQDSVVSQPPYQPVPTDWEYQGTAPKPTPQRERRWYDGILSPKPFDDPNETNEGIDKARAHADELSRWAAEQERIDAAAREARRQRDRPATVSTAPTMAPHPDTNAARDAIVADAAAAEATAEEARRRASDTNQRIEAELAQARSSSTPSPVVTNGPGAYSPAPPGEETAPPPYEPMNPTTPTGGFQVASSSPSMTTPPVLEPATPPVVPATAPTTAAADIYAGFEVPSASGGPSVVGQPAGMPEVPPSVPIPPETGAIGTAPEPGTKGPDSPPRTSKPKRPPIRKVPCPSGTGGDRCIQHPDLRRYREGQDVAGPNGERFKVIDKKKGIAVRVPPKIDDCGSELGCGQ